MYYVYRGSERIGWVPATNYAEAIVQARKAYGFGVSVRFMNY